MSAETAEAEGSARSTTMAQKKHTGWERKQLQGTQRKIAARKAAAAKKK
jgi:hypothetical protein